MQHLLPNMLQTFLSYIRAPLQGYHVLDTDYGFVLLGENNSVFAK